jgi:SAM-dependent methyltransferase
MHLQALQQDHEAHSHLPDNNGFEKQYIAVRSKEGRIYTDRELARLPDIAPQHPHYREWVVRKASAEKLTAYLQKKGKALRILEVGCGNGWFSNRLAMIGNASVTGLDVNLTELNQAQSVFGHNPALAFVYGDLRSGVLQEARFDLVVFAASIPYFSVLPDILATAMQYLEAGGEIHIIDSHLYPPGGVRAAKERTKAYYANLGVPEMADHYFHHALDELLPFPHSLLFNPYSMMNRLTGKGHCFPWVCIRRR